MLFPLPLTSELEKTHELVILQLSTTSREDLRLEAVWKLTS
jgi:hypothetical protein